MVMQNFLFALFIESTLALNELFLVCAPCSLGHGTFLFDSKYLQSLNYPTVLRQLGVVGDEVDEHDDVARLECLADTLVLGAEDSPVPE